MSHQSVGNNELIRRLLDFTLTPTFVDAGAMWETRTCVSRPYFDVFMVAIATSPEKGPTFHLETLNIEKKKKRFRFLLSVILRESAPCKHAKLML